MDNTDFAKRMKEQEQVETKARYDKSKPLVIRLDGRSFSKFTKPFDRPFDADFRNVMKATTEHLVAKTNAIVGYTQSDEITLVLPPQRDNGEFLFNGKKYKILSNLAAMATSKFVIDANKYWPDHVEKMVPSFDCRAFNVESDIEAMNHVLWRYKDCVRNSISMVAHSNFSHTELHKKSTTEKLSMLRLRKNVEWEDYSNECKYGIFVYRKPTEVVLDEKELARIPDQHRPENGIVVRNVLIRDSMAELNVHRLIEILK